MADEALHYPGQEPEPPAPEPQPEPAQETSPAPATPEAPAPEPTPAEPDKKEPETPPAPESPLPKKRSIYDDLKDTRQEKNAWRDAAVAALKSQGIELTGKETPEELQALTKATPAPKPAEATPAPAPKEPAAPGDDLDAFAKENELDANAMKRLVEIISKRIPAAQLSEAEKADLTELKTWREERARQQEDDEVLSQRESVKTQLQIHDDAELQNVMKEVVKLSHTKEFHDKEVEYIIWKNKDALSKLVSPKKPSFESGGLRTEAAPEAEPDFSTGKVTPETVSKAMNGRGGSQLDIRKGH
jgi:pyruvate/2-oxoglutarate dehydrogenase complex dihydrolipoamide acyltransferase (E2) component